MTSLPQRESNGDFDQDVDRTTLSGGGRETPLPHCSNCALLETGAQRLHHANVADRPVASHDDLEHDITLEGASPRLFGVERAYLFQECWRRDA
jgi:hypothetical protein